MNVRLLLQISVLLCLFIGALVLEIAPWPASLQTLKPAWVVLVLMYWVLAIPRKVSIGSAFLLGLVWDLILGSILGVHALVLSVFTYLVTLNHIVLRNLSLWVQSLFVILFVFVIKFSIFVVELLLHNAYFNWQEIWGAVTSGILWPWVYLLQRKIRHKLELR